MEKVWQFISDALPSQVIEKDNLKFEALSNLSHSQVKYLQMIDEKGLLSSESVSCIQEYMKNFPGGRNSDA